MRPIQYVSAQEILSRVFHLFALLMMLENTAFGLHRGFGRGIFDSKMPFPRRKVFSRNEASQALRTFLKRSTAHHIAMSNVKEAYTMFYDEWQLFAESVPSKLNFRTPWVLWSKIDVVAKIIKPWDSAFYSLDTEDVIKRVMLTLGVAHWYLQKLNDCRYVRRNPESQRFFTTAKKTLHLMMTMTKMSLANLRFRSVHNEVEVVDAGIGQINTGILQGMKLDVLLRLKELVHALNSKKC